MKFSALASGSTGNLYTLEDAETRIIIECGLPYKQIQKLLPLPPTHYAACLITHSHADHSYAAQELQRRGIPIHCSNATAESIGLRRGWTEAGSEQIGTLQIKTYEAQHDVPNLMFLIRSTQDGETLLFAIDTYYIRENFHGITIWACECNYSKELLQDGDALADRLYTSHMELRTLLSALASSDLSQCREIHLLHISRDRGDPQAFARATQEQTGIPVYAAQPITTRNHHDYQRIQRNIPHRQ
ncbi:MBL fold metallo-hydrolase [Chlorobium phaeovibrioides]|uniref:MBL fold metallo-hydrolase n=1 Tax=Chlorobium phaeovibrioides TaxID=1094 RepID=A0A432AWC8_CHLPH|nr:MBL fold metallo-hydrolase [Chlorobium phaeovibrioides]KAA6233130.1 MBL fold metallo-hydrolase [Chlorobium phaeovibrioides]MDT9546531.1 MBL fold metallo-hydrolase [Chlorobium phaeovibrioides]RTY36522.1 MBL fold metallo-hydrolase [Chlorobium phaeovibrioides]RTY39559.1 MBL fold metallo-hydrolase [Chlorobium phaeovibrioides]